MQFDLEQEVQANPYSLGAWLHYLKELDKRRSTTSQDEKTVSPEEGRSGTANVHQAARELNLVYERALVQLPSSYKLWSSYLETRMSQVEDFHPNHAAVCAIGAVFERAVTALPMMPRLWISYGGFLFSRRSRLEEALSVYRRALQTLPTAQHNKVWVEGLKPLAAHPACPPSLSTALLRQYLNLKNDIRAHYAYLEQLYADPAATATSVDVVIQLANRFSNVLTKVEFWDNALPHLERGLSLPDVAPQHEALRLVAAGIAVCPEMLVPLLRMFVFLATRVGDYTAARAALIRLQDTATTTVECHEILVLRHSFEQNALELLASHPTQERFAMIYGEQIKSGSAVGSSPPSNRKSKRRDDDGKEEEEDEDPVQTALTFCESLIQEYAHAINTAALRSSPKDVQLWIREFQLLTQMNNSNSTNSSTTPGGFSARSTSQHALSRAFQRANEALGSSASWLLCISYLTALEECGLAAHEQKMIEDVVLASIKDEEALIHVLLDKYPQDRALTLLRKIAQQPNCVIAPVCVEVLVGVIFKQKGLSAALNFLDEAVDEGSVSVAAVLRLLRRLRQPQLEALTSGEVADGVNPSTAASEVATIVGIYHRAFQMVRKTKEGVLLWVELVHYLALAVGSGSTNLSESQRWSAQQLESWRALVTESQSDLKTALTHHPRRRLAVLTALQEWNTAVSGATAAAEATHLGCMDLLTEVEDILTKRLIVSTESHRRSVETTLRRIPFVTTYGRIAAMVGASASLPMYEVACNAIARIINKLAEVPVPEDHRRFVLGLITRTLNLLWDMGLAFIHLAETTAMVTRCREIYRFLVHYTLLERQPQPVKVEAQQPAVAGEGGPAATVTLDAGRSTPPPAPLSEAEITEQQRRALPSNRLWVSWRRFEANNGSKTTFQEVTNLRNNLAKQLAKKQ